MSQSFMGCFSLQLNSSRPWVFGPEVRYLTVRVYGVIQIFSWIANKKIEKTPLEYIFKYSRCTFLPPAAGGRMNFFVKFN